MAKSLSQQQCQGTEFQGADAAAASMAAATAAATATAATTAATTTTASAAAASPRRHVQRRLCGHRPSREIYAVTRQTERVLSGGPGLERGSRGGQRLKVRAPVLPGNTASQEAARRVGRRPSCRE